MHSSKLEKIESLFHSAIELGKNERKNFLSEIQKEDPEIYSEVKSLLAFENEAENFIEESAAQITAKSLGEEFNQDYIGKTIGSYEIKSFLGGGGMGEVFLAVDERLGRRVALKILSVNDLTDEEYVRRFEVEARAASALNHPGILTIYEFGKTDDLYYISTELVEGKTLRQHFIDQDLKLPGIIKIAVQTAEALKTAHNANIIHRDIKPENIMIRKDDYVKILDFGIAKLIDKEALVDFEGKNLTLLNTKTGIILGTPSYMSPEQIRGQKVDHRTDIFSLGVVLYEMISNRQPFLAKSPSATIASILLDEPEPLERFSKTIPLELQEIIVKALKKDKNERYQTMDEMIADLKELREQMQFENTADIHQSVSLNNAQTVSTQKTGQNNFFDKNKILLAASALFLLLLTTLGFYFYSSTKDKKIESVAVMPFVNKDADSETEFLADSLTESIIDRLSKLSDFKVKSFNTVSRFKENQSDAQTIGRELGVQTVLFTRLKQNGENVSVNTELVSVEDNSRIWSYQYNGKSADLLSMQQTIAREISEKLNLELNGNDKKVLAKRETQNSEAFRLYLKGRFFWNKRTGESLKRAIDFFEQAIEKDPTYALAYAGLADSYGLLSNYTDTPPKESMPKAKSAAQKALEIDKTLAEAHTSLGLVKKEYEWDFEGAEKDFKRAIEINPNYATAHQWRAENLVTLKRFDEALDSMKKAHELEPFSLIISSEVGWVLHHAGNYDEAIKQFEKTAELDPNFVRVHFFLGRSFEQKKLYEKAIESTKKAIEISGGNTLFKASLAHIYASAGRKAEAEKILKELQKHSDKDYVSPFAFALVYAGLDEKEKSLDWLEKAFEQRDTILFNYIRDPQLKSLQNEKRFADLLEKVGLTVSG